MFDLVVFEFFPASLNPLVVGEERKQKMEEIDTLELQLKEVGADDVFLVSKYAINVLALLRSLIPYFEEPLMVFYFSWLVSNFKVWGFMSFE